MTSFSSGGIAYDRGGPRGELPIMLIHAGVADRGMWGPIWPELTGDRDVVRVDLRGFGDSAARPAGALGTGLATAFAAEGAQVTGIDRAEPRQPLPGVSHRDADVLDDVSLGALFDDLPVPWAVVNTVGGFAPHTPLAELDPDVLAGQLRLNLVSAALIT